MPDLKPCPLCGDPATLMSNGFSFGVKCLFCGLLLPTIYETREEAKKAWNRRTQDSDGLKCAAKIIAKSDWKKEG